MAKSTNYKEPYLIRRSAIRAKLFDALNRIDEHASRAVEDNDNGEAEQYSKDFNLMFDFINTHALK